MPSRSTIIDHMLRTLGESGVSNDQSTHPTVQLCSSTLNAENEEVQLRGWWFNREYDLKLVPDNRGEIVMPGNTLSIKLSSVDTSNVATKIRYVFRDGLLYDNLNHTFNIGEAVYMDVIVQLDIDDMPASAQNYLKHKAAETVFLNEDGDQNKLKPLERKTQLAWQTLMAEGLRNTAVNALDKNVAQTLNKGWYASGSRNPNYIGGRIR